MKQKEKSPGASGTAPRGKPSKNKLHPVGGGFSVRFSITFTDYGLVEPEREWHPHDPGPAEHHKVNWERYNLACEKFYPTLSEADREVLGVGRSGGEGTTK